MKTEVIALLVILLGISMLGFHKVSIALLIGLAIWSCFKANKKY